VLRIHFTVADLARTRVAVLGPLAELQLSFTKLLVPERRPVIEGWLTRTVPHLRTLPPDVREVATGLVAPPLIQPVDLFSLVGPVDDYADGMERLSRVPARAVHNEFDGTAADTGICPGWVADFAGDRAARLRFTRALDEYHAVAIAPYWPRMRTLLENERKALVGILAVHGLDAMLAGLGPGLRWRSPVLEVPAFRREADYHLNGRGLVLASTVFGTDEPTVYEPQNDEPAVLVHRIEPDPVEALALWRPAGEPGNRALAGLLGTTRAAALREIAAGCTTTELARRLAISPGGASQHATVLRQAGLVASRRYRNTMRHTLTRLGADLLEAT
jgi:DNA-binding transcriptional ArsR family regulator